jgi:4-methylaminobutanoate oxidase (formaldehyde-forming)
MRRMRLADARRPYRVALTATGDPPMSERIIIIGGGVIGAAIAAELGRRKAGDILLLERDRLGSGTTWHSAGNITWKPSAHHDQPILHMLDTVSRLESETGRSTGWLKTGRQFIARSEETLQSLREFARHAEERRIGARWLDPAEARRLNPLIEPSAAKGIWLNPLSGRLNPADLTWVYATAARNTGVRILEMMGARRLIEKGGRITGVETEEGPVLADLVIVASGLWSRALVEPVGYVLPLWPCEHMYLIAELSQRLPRETPSFVAPDHLIYGREEVGGLLVGFFDEKARTIDKGRIPEPFAFSLFDADFDKVAPYFEGAVAVFPALAEAPIRRFINGPEAFTPDGSPLIGPVPGLPGLMVATAMNSAGVTWSSMTATLIADQIAGKRGPFDPAPFAVDRFGQRGRDEPWLRQQVSDVVAGGYRRQNR